MSFDNLFFPRVETIVVPENVRPESIGTYATYAAYKILESLGISEYNQKTITLQPVNERLYALRFNGKAPLQPSKDIFLEVSDAKESSPVETSGVAVGNTKRPGNRAAAANTAK